MIGALSNQHSHNYVLNDKPNVVLVLICNADLLQHSNHCKNSFLGAPKMSHIFGVGSTFVAVKNYCSEVFGISVLKSKSSFDICHEMCFQLSMEFCEEANLRQQQPFGTVPHWLVCILQICTASTLRRQVSTSAAPLENHCCRNSLRVNYFSTIALRAIEIFYCIARMKL